MADTIGILAKRGDPLEREICKHSPLRVVLQPYAEIWLDHVYCRRESDGTRVPDEWMNFAGSHYTALLRVYHAYQRLLRIQQLALADVTLEECGKVLLEVHHECASFWEHVGSAIENLSHVLEDCVPPIFESREGLKFLQEKYPDLKYAYDRRTQFIHYRVVPAAVHGGTVVFRYRRTELAQRHLEPKETRWDLAYDERVPIGDHFSKEWQRFLNTATNAWHYLRGRLRNVDKGGRALLEAKMPGKSWEQMHVVLIEDRGDPRQPPSTIVYQPGDEPTPAPIVPVPPNAPGPSG